MNWFLYKKELSVEKINSAFKKFSNKHKNKVLEIIQEKLVSIDFNHNPASSIVDANLTSVRKIWVKFLLGMIMNGVSQIECVI